MVTKVDFLRVNYFIDMTIRVNGSIFLFKDSIMAFKVVACYYLGSENYHLLSSSLCESQNLLVM